MRNITMLTACFVAICFGVLFQQWTVDDTADQLAAARQILRIRMSDPIAVKKAMQETMEIENAFRK